MSATLQDLRDDGIAPLLYELAVVVTEKLIRKGVDRESAENAVVSLVQCSMLAGKVEAFGEAREVMAQTRVDDMRDDQIDPDEPRVKREPDPDEERDACESEDVMAPETRTALQGSIRKWEAIVAGTGVDNASANCPLCELFVDKINPDPETNGVVGCFGCPVSAVAKADGCSLTPYTDWSRLFPYAQPHPLSADTPERKAAAQRELDFLRSLLPAKYPPNVDAS